jgi:hypothetical protein
MRVGHCSYARTSATTSRVGIRVGTTISTASGSVRRSARRVRPCRRAGLGRGAFSYFDGVLADGATLKLCERRYPGSAHHWGFAIYRASHDDYQESIFPTGQTRRHCEDALDTACGLYLGDRTTWT